MEKEVRLERKEDTFGFSVFGGAGTKLPPAVCEVTPGGPADLCRKMQVGDVIKEINGVNLDYKKPDEVVQIIRAAPTSSRFKLVENDAVKEKTLEYLKKKERKALKAKKKRVSAESFPSTGSEQSLETVSRAGFERGKSDSPLLKDTTQRKADRDVKEGRASSNKTLQKSNSFTSVQYYAAITIVGSHGDRSTKEALKRRLSLESSDILKLQVHNGDCSGPPATGKSGGNPPRWNIAPNGCPHRHSGEHSNHSNTKIDNPDKHLPQSEGQTSPSTTTTAHSRDSTECGRVRSGSDSTLRSDSATPIPGQERETPPAGDGETPPAGDGKTPLIEDGGVFPMVDGLGHITQYQEDTPSLDQTTPTTETSKVLPDQVQTPVEKEERKESVISASGIFLSLTVDRQEDRLGDISEDGEEENPTHQKGHDQDFIAVDLHENTLLSQKQRSLSSGTVLDESTAAADLARKLFKLEGIKKEAVSKQLSLRSNFGTIVAKGYVEHFDFKRLSLDAALRMFLSSFALMGESQEIDRIMSHFSQHYHNENPGTFPSKDTIHAIVSAMLLLNSDLHKEHADTKMSSSEFVSNVMQLEVEFPQNKKEFQKYLKTLYDSIKRNPIKYTATSESDDSSERGGSPQSDTSQQSPPGSVHVYKVTIPGSFVEVDLPGDAPVFKEGQVMRKNVMEGPHKKVPRGHRGWKGYHAYLKGFLLYFSEPHTELRLEDTRNALPIMNCLATRAYDYSKKSAVLRVTTADWHVFLLQASNMLEVQQWMLAINRSAATYSCPPLAAAVGSGSTNKFIRPMFPMRPATTTMEEQCASHLYMIDSLEKELAEHRQIKPSGKGTSGRTADWFDKYEYLQYEISRYRIYHVSLTSDVDISQLNAPLPSVLMPSPSTLTLATANADTWQRYRGPPSPTPSSSSSYKGSPLLRRKGYLRN